MTCYTHAVRRLRLSVWGKMLYGTMVANFEMRIRHTPSIPSHPIPSSPIQSPSFLCLPPLNTPRKVAINVLEHIPDMRLLLLGRVLGGISTSLLFSAFESWMVSQHRKQGEQNVHPLSGGRWYLRREASSGRGGENIGVCVRVRK